MLVCILSHKTKYLHLLAGKLQIFFCILNLMLQEDIITLFYRKGTVDYCCVLSQHSHNFLGTYGGWQSDNQTNTELENTVVFFSPSWTVTHFRHRHGVHTKEMPIKKTSQILNHLQLPIVIEIHNVTDLLTSLSSTGTFAQIPT